LKFVAVAQLHPETLQNIVLAAIDGGLIGAHRVGHLDFCAFLPKELFGQSSLKSQPSDVRPYLRHIQPQLSNIDGLALRAA